MKYGFGVDIGGTTIKIGLFSVDGDLIEKWEIPTNKTDNGKHILKEIADFIHRTIKEKNIDKTDVLGVGLGVPGPVNKNGVVNGCVNLGWNAFNVEKEFNEISGFRVKVGNDANVAALGEMWQGAGKGYQDVLMVTLGTGVGGGCVLDGKIVSGIHGAGGEIGEYLATSKRIAKVAFTGSTEVGQQIMQYATQNIIPVTLELGGKSPNIFFADVMEEEDAFFDKALEGFALFAFNQGEVCTCPSRALVQESIYERFMERAIRRVESIRSGNPLDNVTQMGAQVSQGQLETILNYIDIGKKEGADILTGGRRKVLGGDLQEGYYLEPTILFGQNTMRVFQEEIFGPVLAVTTFKTMEEALAIANDTPYGLGAGVWSRNGNLAYKMGRGIQAGRVWTNCYHAYPAHAAFGGYKQSGIGRETHKMMLEHYQQTKCLLVSYSDKPLGLF